MSAVIDGCHADVWRLAESVAGKDQLATVQAAYEVVREQFAHSYDIVPNRLAFESGSPWPWNLLC
jgi:hypothetical protein